MKIKKVLIVYKRSSFEKYALHDRDPHYLKLIREGNIATRASKRVHKQHTETFEQVKLALSEVGIRFVVRQRYHLIPIRGFDLVITVGGDGTFLGASHYMEEGILLGVNSDPLSSVGFYCRANRWNFRQKLLSILRDRHRLQKLSRLKLKLPGRKKSPLILNDLLLTNFNPAATARYILTVKGKKEDQKSSGIWIAPAPGSTAAIHSAGGKVLPIGSSKFQYVVREPYFSSGNRYRLLRGILQKKDKISLLAMTGETSLYLDGPRLLYRLKRGDKVTIGQSNKPLHVVW